MKTKFAENLRELRLLQKLSQEQLGSALKTTQRKVSYWESGKIDPDLESLWLIADYFEVSIDFLLGRREF